MLQYMLRTEIRSTYMAKQKKKKRKKIRLFPLLVLIVIGSIGYYVFHTIKGAVLTILLYYCLKISFKIWRKYRQYARLRKAGIKEIDEMTGEEFEQFLGHLFKKRGFKVTYTAASGDYGADLLLKDRDELIAVQAKRYSDSVGVKAVQEIIGALKMYDATQAWVVTNSYFTKQAVKLAEMNDVYLIDRDELIEIILNER